MDPLDIW